MNKNLINLMSKNLYNLIPAGGIGANDFLRYYAANSSDINETFQSFKIETLEDLNAAAYELYKEDFEPECYDDYIWTLIDAEMTMTRNDWKNYLYKSAKSMQQPLLENCYNHIMNAMEEAGLVKEEV